MPISDISHQDTGPISWPDFWAAVQAAVRAPSLYNSQPWRFRLAGDRVQVVADVDRTPPVADPDGWAARIACGAATYNLQLAFAVAGQPMRVSWLPQPGPSGPGQPQVVAVLHPLPRGPAQPWQHRLFAAIVERRSNRRPFRSQAVAREARLAVIEAAVDEGAWLDLVVGRIPVAAVSEIAHAAHRVLQRNAAYTAEMAVWTRPATSGGNADPHDLLPQRPLRELVQATTDGEDDPLIAVLGTTGDRPVDHLKAGYALQRVLLTITAHGLASSLLSAPIEVPSAREQLRIALGRTGTPQMVLRVGYADPAPATPRRPVADVIDSAPSPADLGHISVS